jgi:tetratricopeptide (TPR) repeat protein
MRQRDKSSNQRRPTKALNVARSLWRDGLFDDAVRKFNEAVREAPNDSAVLIEAACALGARYQFRRSEGLLERALRLAPRNGDLLHAAGEAYLAVDRSDRAEFCFRRACLVSPSSQSQLELAKICERRHALEDAADLVARILRSEPHSIPALLLCARIERRRGDLDRARGTLQRIVAGAANHPMLLAEAYGELCLALDAAGEYDAAWEAILGCKRILLQHDAAAWSAAQFVLARCARMVEALTADHFSRWQTMPKDIDTMRLAVLTGFPRAGTTLLEQVLDSHPEVVSSEEKEVFGADIFPQLGTGRPLESPIESILDSLTDEQVTKARAAYLAAMEGMLGEPIGTRLHLDKNPAVNLMIPAMRRIFPELKIIVAVRDPRDIIVSCFLRYLPITPVSVCFLALNRVVDRFLLDMGAWLKMRDIIGNWVEVRYEDTVHDVAHEARRVLEALALPWDDAVLHYRGRAKRKPIRSPSYEEVARPIFTSSIGRWQNYERQLAPVITKLAPLIKSLGYDV